MDPERKDPSKDGEGQPEGAQPTAAATSATATPDPKYKGLQQAVDSERLGRLKAEAELAKLRGDPSAEEQLAATRQELDRLQGEIAIRDLKAEHPELGDIIDVAKAEGLKLTPGVIAAMKAKVAAQGSSAPAATTPLSSGIRNSPAGGKPLTGDETKFMELLQKGNLWS